MVFAACALGAGPVHTQAPEVFFALNLETHFRKSESFRQVYVPLVAQHAMLLVIEVASASRGCTQCCNSQDPSAS